MQSRLKANAAVDTDRRDRNHLLQRERTRWTLGP